MACFLVPASEAIVTTAIEKIVKPKFIDINKKAFERGFSL